MCDDNVETYDSMYDCMLRVLQYQGYCMKPAQDLRTSTMPWYSSEFYTYDIQSKVQSANAYDYSVCTHTSTTVP